MSTRPKIRFIREGARGKCSLCHRERDLLSPVVPRYNRTRLNTVGMDVEWIEQRLDPVLSRHLVWPEQYSPKGTFPNGFCDGSLKPPLVIERAKHNHVTRDIRKPGKCPACDEYHARRAAKE